MKAKRDVFDILFNLFIASVLLFIIVSIIKVRYKRYCVNADPISTKAIVTKKKVIADGGYPCVTLYYKFYANDTIVYGKSSAAPYSIGKDIRVGDRIIIVYEKDNPNNSYFEQAPYVKK